MKILMWLSTNEQDKIILPDEARFVTQTNEDCEIWILYEIPAWESGGKVFTGVKHHTNGVIMSAGDVGL